MTGREGMRNGSKAFKSSDVNRLWTDLHRIVSHHPLVRASRSAGLLVEEGAGAAYTDLTQELFVQLLSKNRFEHYLETEMTDYEIECEISQIELTNLLTAELRKRHPESYRLARRISTLIQSSPNFRRFDTSGIDDEPHRRLADRVYGLKRMEGRQTTPWLSRRRAAGANNSCATKRYTNGWLYRGFPDCNQQRRSGRPDCFSAGCG